jgi:ADP-ribose pyrophosphatase YjhB (NUDIX family)
MSGSNYIKSLRSKVGNSILMIPSVAAVILDSSNRLLLQEKSSEAWSLPAGMIEPGESPNEAIVREVKEETGLIITPNKILGVFGGEQFRYIYPNGDRVEYTVILMNCSIVGDTGEITDSETKSLQYYDKKSMPELALPYPKEVLFNELTASYIQ